jgi:CRP-like cAMP-binding protein
MLIAENLSRAAQRGPAYLGGLCQMAPAAILLDSFLASDLHGARASCHGIGMAKLNRALLADIPVFNGLSGGELDEIVGIARAVRYPQETSIFEQDSEAHAFFLLLDGHIRVVRTTPNGAKIIARYIPAGELFGIAAALGRNTYPATAIAAVDCVALVWPNSAWEHLSSRFPAFRAGTYQTVASRLEDAQARVAELATERVEQRVASAMIRLVEQSPGESDDGIAIDFPLSREDIAEMTGTTLHTVSRLLTNWMKQGWIAGGRQRVIVKDKAALTRIATRARP